jgi:hypothetical protein
LRDLGRPQRLFQVTHPDLGRDFAPLRTLETFPGNLPLQTSSFVGREAQLALLAELVPGSSLVTLTGVGGVGKTRLALQVAAEVIAGHRAYFEPLTIPPTTLTAAPATAAHMVFPFYCCTRVVRGE